MMRRVFLFALFIIFMVGLFFVEYFYQPLVLEESTIKVQVVYHEKIYDLELENYATLDEALEMVELKDDVEEAALNRNEILSHRDIIHIPIKQDIPCISINHASAEELEIVKGIGPKTAESIIIHKNTYGRFQTIDELLEVKGIGEKTLESIKDSLCL